MIPQATEEAIKAAADIHDVVGRFVDLKKSGSRYLGLCPFHSEKTGSFYVTPSLNICKCFGCGKGGDPIWFVMAYKKKTYPEALEFLAGLYNIPIDAAGNKPKADFAPPPRPTPPPPPPMSIFPKEKMLATLKGYDRNHFAQFLKDRFGAAIASDLIGRYFVGTSKHFSGANVFWQVDALGRVRGGKIMVYHADTGKRDREKLPNGRDKTTWTHTAAKMEGFVLSQCFFGEHLLAKRPNAPVCVVESEKTAILASAYLPQNIWLASGGKDGLGLNKCAVLKGRSVTLWPDASLPDKDGKTAFQLWSDKAAELQKAGYSFSVSNLIERLATSDERAAGFDLADYLLRFDPAAFQSVEVPQAAPQCPTANEVEPDAPKPAQIIEYFTCRTTGKRLEHLMTDDGGYPAIIDETLPPAPSLLQQAAKRLASHGWEAGRVQAITDDSERGWQAARERATLLASWTDFKAGKGPNPYTSHAN
jgi:hypothetical protein